MNTKGSLANGFVKVAVVDRLESSRSILQTMIDESERLALAGLFCDLVPILHQPEAMVPDVVLISLRHKLSFELSSLRELKETMPDIQVLVLTPLKDESIIVALIEAGADGLLIEPLTRSQLVEAVIAVYDQGVPLSPIAARYLVNRLRPRRLSLKPTAELLTPREFEILNHVAYGRTDKEIAQLLCLSLLTVKRHLHNSYSKLGVENRVQAINRVALTMPA